MIPSPSQLDKDLIKIFSTTENKAIKQTISNNIVVKSDNIVDVSRSLWSKDIKHINSFERGYITGMSINEANKPDVNSFINDLFDSIKDNIYKELENTEHTKDINNIFAAIKQILSLLISRCREADSKVELESEKIQVQNILAGLHGYITAYIISAYHPQLKK